MPRNIIQWQLRLTRLDLHQFTRIVDWQDLNRKNRTAKEDFKMYIKQMPEAHDKISIEQAISQM